MSLFKINLDKICNYIERHKEQIHILPTNERVRFLCSRLHISKRMLNIYLLHTDIYSPPVRKQIVASNPYKNQRLICDKNIIIKHNTASVRFFRDIVASNPYKNQRLICNNVFKHFYVLNMQDVLNIVARNSLYPNDLFATKIVSAGEFKKEKNKKRKSNKKKKTRKEKIRTLIYSSSRKEKEKENIIKEKEKEKWSKKKKEVKMNEKSVSKKVVEKKQFADCVFLTENEYDKLIRRYGKKLTDWAISKVSNYKMYSGKKYKSDYHAILQWGIQSAIEQENRLLRQGISLPEENKTETKKSVKIISTEEAIKIIEKERHIPKEEVETMKQMVEMWKQGKYDESINLKKT